MTVVVITVLGVETRAGCTCVCLCVCVGGEWGGGRDKHGAEDTAGHTERRLQVTVSHLYYVVSSR
jgi:hypothetical protein